SLFVPFRYRQGSPQHAYRCYRHTRGHNCVTADDKGQPISSDAYGYICRFIDGDKLTYTCGDASNAYAGIPSPQWWDRVKSAGLDWYEEMENKSVSKFRRHLLFIKPGLIVVYDELEATKDVQWQWVLHCRKTLETQENGLRVKEEDAKLNFFASEKLNFDIRHEALVPPFNIDRRGGKKPTVYKSKGTHVHVSPDKKCKKLRILSLIQLGTNHKLINNEDGSINCGDWSIKAELNIDKKAILSIEHKDGKTSFINLNGESMSVLQENGLTKTSGEIFPLAVGK
ncbi:MAG: heparinase II/III family protein, partial [Lentisphaeraceae bacterium]|nr:heparinase II/III family protein [Lentisphaeraceae bacterium]